MARLAQTHGLTDVQPEILSTVRTFVDKEILPYATDLEHKDEFPEAIVEGMKEMGLFGLMIAEEYGGLGESLLTYALVVEQIARGWMSVSGVINTHFIVAYMINQHGTEEQKEHFLPKMATGEIRGAFSMSEPECGTDVAAIKSRAVREGDEYVLNGQKMWLTNGARAGVVATLGEDRRGRGLRLQEHDDVPHREGAGLRHPRRDRSFPARSRRWATRASRPPRWSSTTPACRPRDPRRRRGPRPRLLPDDGRRRGRPRQRRGARVRHLDPRLRARRSRTRSSARPSASRSPTTRPSRSSWPRWRPRSRRRT